MTDDATEPPLRRLRPRRRRRTVRAVVACVLVALLASAVVAIAPWDAERRQAYADQWIVWTEPPSAEIEQLAHVLALTETGRRIFFATQPQVEPADQFGNHCPVEGDIVLGCYHRDRIYVYEVTDERLAGTVESTAAHELLHAYYARLSRAETARIDALVASVVDALPDDDGNRPIVDGYRTSQHADEWHSRLGTSYAELPDELEAHYAEVFADRARILAFDRESTAQLDEYTALIERLSAELDELHAELESRAATYDVDAAGLEDDIRQFNDRADRGDFDSQADFAREREQIVARQDALERRRLALNADVDRYNETLAELRALDAERSALFAELDSRRAPES